MYLVRDIMYCRPGKVRAMVEKFTTLAKLSETQNLPKFRILTDVCAERYWTVVTEMEVESIDALADLSRQSMAIPEFQEAMKGYHDLVENGRREIYVIERK